MLLLGLKRMPDSKDKRAEGGAANVVVPVPSTRAVSGARELQRPSERPTMPPAMPSMPEVPSTPSMPSITNPPISHERALRVDRLEDEDDIPELLRSASARPPTTMPSGLPLPNVPLVRIAKQVRGFEEEVVINRKDPRREE